jgi:hypothetical protein
MSMLRGVGLPYLTVSFEGRFEVQRDTALDGETGGTFRGKEYTLSKAALRKHFGEMNKCTRQSVYFFPRLR